MSRSDVLARELGDDSGISLAERARAAEGVNLASTAEDRFALSVGSGIRGAEELTADGGLNGGIDVLESVTLGKDVAARADLEGVTLNVVEVVVDGMEEGIALNLGHTAGGVVEVVTLHGDHVVGSIKVDTPVVVAVAGSRVVGAAVDEGVGDGDTVVGLGTEDDVLTGDTGSGNVVDPDKVSLVQGDGITTPDILRVDVSDSDVLDDDVLGAADDTDTTALNDTGTALANKRLVGVDGDTENTGLVVGDAGHFRGVGLVVVAPVILVYGELATGASTPRSTTRSGFSALSVGKVEGLGKDDNTRLAVTEV